MRVVYFESEDDGDGNVRRPDRHAYLPLDHGSTGDELGDLGVITRTEPRESLPSDVLVPLATV